MFRFENHFEIMFCVKIYDDIFKSYIITQGAKFMITF